MLRASRLPIFGALALCLALHTGPVFAQASASEKAAAEALFDQGVRSMKQSNFADACPKLEESNRIDPAVGTLLYLAECYERSGKTASAWATFREAASLANNSGQTDRARIATRRAEGLEEKLSRLSIEVAADVANVPGLRVLRGGQRIEPSLYGTALPIDPGEYRIDVTAPGHHPYSTSVKVESGGTSTAVRVPALAKSSEPPAPARLPEAAPRSPVEQTSPPLVAPASSDSGGLSTRQTLGIAVGAAGIVGIGAGSFFGIRAIAKNSDAEPHCPTSGFCKDEQGLQLTREAQRQARLSNIAFAAGGILLGAGAVLYLTGNNESRERVALVPMVSTSALSAGVVGRFH